MKRRIGYLIMGMKTSLTLLQRFMAAMGWHHRMRIGALSDMGRFTRYVAPLPQVQYLKAGEGVKSTHGTWEVRIDQGHSQAHRLDG